VNEFEAMSGARASPGERFFGVDGHPGPFDLLGLPTAEVSAEQVIGALDARLATLAAHSEGATPEADELRLALHAAAAQLLDPAVRDHLVSAWSSEADEARVRRVELQRDAVLLLGSMGGWSKQSLRRLAMLAHARGIASEELADVLAGLARPAVAPSVATPQSRSAKPLPRVMVSTSATGGPVAAMESAPKGEIDPMVSLVRAATIVGGGFVCVLIVLAVIVLRLIAPASGPQTPAPGDVTTPVDSVPLASVETTNATPTVATTARQIDPDETLRRLRAAVGDLETERDAAVERVGAALDDWASSWTRWTPDRTQAATAALLDGLYRLGADNASAAVLLKRVASESGEQNVNAETLERSAWGAGLMTRLLGERDLPIAQASMVNQAVAEAFPGVGVPGETSFRAGVLARLGVIAKDLAAPARCDPKAWARWRDALGAVAASDGPTRQRASLLAMEGVMLSSDEPSGGERFVESIAELVAGVSWKRGDESRAWLLRWFATPAISSGDLNALTHAMAFKSAAEGVDVSMVLSPDASDRARAELRDRFSLAWGMGSGEDRNVVVERWLIAADAKLDLPMPLSRAGQLAEAIVLSRLCQAGVLAYSGEPALAQSLLDSIDDDLPTLDTARPRTGDEKMSGLSEWGVKYAALGTAIQQRIELLSQVSGERAMAAGDADLLVRDAIGGTPSAVRRAARDAMRRVIDNRWVVVALLDALPNMPVTPENAELVDVAGGGPLPALRSPRWRIEARRQLVQRCLEFIARGGEGSLIDALAGKLAESYEARAAAGRPSSTPLGMPVEKAADELLERTRLEAAALIASGREPLSLETIRRRDEARAGLVSGPVQGFVARQTTLVELAAFCVVAERPARAAKAKAIHDAFVQASLGARDVCEQVWLGEKAAAELWCLRLSPTKEATP